MYPKQGGMMFDLNSLNNSALHLTKRKLPDSHEMEKSTINIGLQSTLHYKHQPLHTCRPSEPKHSDLQVIASLHWAVLIF